MPSDRVEMDKVLEATQRGQQTNDGLTLDLTPLEDTGTYPWERMPGEPNNWYDKFFKYYLKQGTKRSLVEAFRRFKGAEGSNRHWSQANPAWATMRHQWNWKVRAEAYDEHERMLDHVKWEARRAKLREKEWKVSNELLNVAEAHIERVRGSQVHPEVSAGTPGRVQVPRAVVKNQDAARFAELGSKLGRLATGMATDQIAVNVQVRMEEVRKRRWDSALPLLQEIQEGDADADANEDIVEGEAVDEPPEESDNGESAN